MPAQPDPIPEPIDDAPAAGVPNANGVPNAHEQRAIDHAQAMLAAHRDRMSGARPTPQSTLQDRDKRLWAGALIETLKEMGYGNTAPNGPTSRV